MAKITDYICSMYFIKEEQKEYFKGFLIPLIPINEWVQKYQISTNPIHCKYCKCELNIKIPFFYEKIRGVIFDTCKCEKSPKDQAPFVFVKSDASERKKDIEDIELILNNYSE